MGDRDAHIRQAWHVNQGVYKSPLEFADTFDPAKALPEETRTAYRDMVVICGGAPRFVAGVIICASRKINCDAVTTALSANLPWMSRGISIYGVASAALSFGHTRSLS